MTQYEGGSDTDNELIKTINNTSAIRKFPRTCYAHR